MSRSRSVVVLAAVCALLVAPAARATSTPIRLMVWVHVVSKLGSTATVSSSRTHTCQADRPGEAKTKTGAKTTLIGDPRHVAVVACEQPPRSEILPASSLERSVPGFIATEG